MIRKDHRTEPARGPKAKPQTFYSATYQYADDQGRSHEGRDGVDASAWNQFQQGQFQMEALVGTIANLVVGAQHNLQEAGEVLFGEKIGNG